MASALAQLRALWPNVCPRASLAAMSLLSPELLALLADPETHEPLRIASDDELASLRAALREGRARRRSGEPLPGELLGALLSQGGRVAYPIEDGIPNLLIDERLELSAD